MNNLLIAVGTVFIGLGLLTGKKPESKKETPASEKPATIEPPAKAVEENTGDTVETVKED